MSLLRPHSLRATPARSTRGWCAAALAGFASLLLALLLSTWQSSLCSGTQSYSAPRAADITALLGGGTQVSITPLPPGSSGLGGMTRTAVVVGLAVVVLVVGGAVVALRTRNRRRS